MKLRLNIALFAALAIGMAACSDDEYTGVPQVSPQEPLMPANGISAVDVVANGSAVNLNDGAIRLINVTKLENFPASSELKVVMKVAKEQSMENAQDVVLVTTEGVDGAVNSCNAPDIEFNKVLKNLFGKNPSEKTVYVNYTAYAVDGTSSVLLGAVGSPQSLKVTPLSLDYVVEDSYYLVNTLDNSSYKMNQSGADVYDDPNFSVVVTVAEGGFAWKVAPASALASLDNAKMYGIDAADAGAGKGELVLGGVAGSFGEPGPYMISINMEKLAYQYLTAYEALYVVGGAQGWSPAAASQMTTKDFETYGGFVPVDGAFKLITTGNGEWSEPQIGSCQFEEGANNSYTATAKFEQGQAGDISGLPTGLWAMTFNMSDKKMSASPVASLEFIGDATGGWGDDDVQVLNPVGEGPVPVVWEATVTFSGNGEYKIRANHGWAFSLGGSAEQLIWDGSNMNSPAAGTYKVTLNLNDPVVHLDMQKVN